MIILQYTYLLLLLLQTLKILPSTEKNYKQDIQEAIEILHPTLINL